MLTLTDLFCGAGGSSSGAIQVPGVQVRMAANHWDLAVQTHNTNHPGADHDCADISQVDPRRYPATDLLWASPECTNHSQAKGRRRSDRTPDLFGDVLPDAAAERSRATMWDVCRFVETGKLRGRPYRGFVVENVVDVRDWLYFDAWRMALRSAGYCLHVVYLNSAYAQGLGAPARSPGTAGTASATRPATAARIWSDGPGHRRGVPAATRWCGRCRRGSDPTGYAAIYSEDVVAHHRAYLARRRALRPSEEYRDLTPEEWQEFLGHFQLRKLELGVCTRDFGTPCIHEHACIRCPALRPDPTQEPRLREIITNLKAGWSRPASRAGSARSRGWRSASRLPNRS